jgi:glycosyltransferase involved in cell wall biosynthesis
LHNRAGLKVGLVTYTNRASGVGVFAWELLKDLGIDSILSVNRKGQEQWLERQVSPSKGCPTSAVEEYLDTYRPDLVLYIETPFNVRLPEMASKRGIRTACIVMQEAVAANFPVHAEFAICPCVEAWQKTGSFRDKRKLLFLPISVKDFPYRKRAGHTFVQNLGWNECNDRRQTATLVKAFHKLEDPDARLILNSQGTWPPGSVIDDPRIEYRHRNTKDPAENFSEGDIYIATYAYEGYGRTILEAMASGMPTLTTDADPMHLFQHDPDFLVEPEPIEHFSGRCAADVTYNTVTADALYKKLEWLLTIDTAEYSERARKQAVAQSWEGSIDYKKVWMETLERICSTA